MWPRDPGMSLQSALKIALQHSPSVQDTILSVGAGAASVRHRRALRQAIYLHIASWTDGEATSTVPHMAEHEAEEDLDALEPDSAWDFLDGDGLVLVSGNHCLIMPSATMRAPKVIWYLRHLLEKTLSETNQLPDEIDTLDLVPIANEPTMGLLRRQGGVKRIDLNLGQHLESARVREDGDLTIIQRLGRGILNVLVDSEDARRRIEQAENVTAKLTIAVQGNRMGIEPMEFAPVAEQIASEDEEDVTLITATGHKIKRGQLVLAKSISLPRFGKTVHHNAGWEAMTEYFNELRENGDLEL